jgi:UDP-N-acetylmuramyl pentapeptide synthase
MLKSNNIEEQFYILGDMNELGESTQSLHEGVGRLLKDLGVRGAAFIGCYSHFYQNGYQGKGRDGETVICQTKVEFVKMHWFKIMSIYSHFFIKGSRSLSLESLLEASKIIKYLS